MVFLLLSRINKSEPFQHRNFIAFVFPQPLLEPAIPGGGPMARQLGAYIQPTPPER